MISIGLKNNHTDKLSLIYLFFLIVRVLIVFLTLIRGNAYKLLNELEVGFRVPMLYMLISRTPNPYLQAWPNDP